MQESNIELQNFPFTDIIYEFYKVTADFYQDNSEIFLSTHYINVLSMVFSFFIMIKIGHSTNV